MRATRLAAAGAAAGAMVLGMAGPALATPGPGSPAPNKPCPKVGEEFTLPDGTKLVCKKGDDGKNVWVPDVDLPTTSPEPEPEPEPTKPEFTFGYDKVKLSNRRVAPGEKVTFTVTCPTTVTVAGNGYTKNPLPVKKTGESTWTATGTYGSDLPDPTTATVVCKDFGSVKYSTSPAKGDDDGNGGGMKPKSPKIPNGRIDTGDGSSLRDGGSPMMAAAWGAVAFLGLGAVALRRRTVRERSYVA